MFEALKLYSQLVEPDSTIIFSYLNNEKEYNELVSLRYRAYKASNKLNINAVPSDLKDNFDQKSKIILAKYNNKIIGSVRVSFFEEGDETLCYKYLSSNTRTPMLDELSEASRLCIEPSMRGINLAYKLEALMILTSYFSNRRYLLGSAENWLVNFHERCGFQRLGISYQNKDFINITHELIILDSYKVIRGECIQSHLYEKYLLPAIEAFQLKY